MARLPKSIIKKYGISKKAWAVFRGSKSIKKSKAVKYMARRRKKHFGGKRNGINFNSVIKILGGAAIVVAYEVFISPMIPLGAQIKNILELIIGMFLAVMPRMPMLVRAAGAALATVNAYALIYPMIAKSGNGGAVAASGYETQFY